VFAVLRCENIVSGYGDTQILWDVNLHVEKGEIVAVLGPNGAGKSTLLKTIMGIVRPWRGRVYFEGRDITLLPVHERVKRGLNMVPEGRALFGDMTVYENIVMALNALPKDRRRVDDVLELVYSLFPVLKERLQQKAKTLSGGEQQMLAIARALVTKPRMLLLDEPTLGLSPKLSMEVIKTVSKLREELGLTILVVEEKIKNALEVSDRVYILNEGRIVKEVPRPEFQREEALLESFLGL
jgi:branched-chain amino acid transport system ATP-binding protein